VEPLLILPASIGAAIAVIFTLARYGHTFTASRIVPAFCRLDDKSCGSIVLGIVFYGLTILAGFGLFPPLLVELLLILAWAGVVMGIYLIHALLVKIKVTCILCMISHSMTLVIAFVLTIR
jgi:hypothetical protein